MITKQQIKELKPGKWIPCFSYTRYRNGQIVQEGISGYSPPRFKKWWDGEKYVPKTERGLSIVVPKKKNKSE